MEKQAKKIVREIDGYGNPRDISLKVGTIPLKFDKFSGRALKEAPGVGYSFLYSSNGSTQRCYGRVVCRTKWFSNCSLLQQARIVAAEVKSHYQTRDMPVKVDWEIGDLRDYKD